ncbi:hypothetical protein DMN91_009457 [Ooceraea biroi]|uniref:Uncharacterized protein n=2 Tax=Ooceraea biroi TaxID=2015173 RepID=A0A3L8DGQ2_OOCBI|nr:hypothetical protein DMN91_009457 [Ooceraea biroi]
MGGPRLQERHGSCSRKEILVFAWPQSQKNWTLRARNARKHEQAPSGCRNLSILLLLVVMAALTSAIPHPDHDHEHTHFIIHVPKHIHKHHHTHVKKIYIPVKKDDHDDHHGHEEHDGW